MKFLTRKIWCILVQKPIQISHGSAGNLKIANNLSSSVSISRSQIGCYWKQALRVIDASTVWGSTLIKLRTVCKQKKDCENARGTPNHYSDENLLFNFKLELASSYTAPMREQRPLRCRSPQDAYALPHPRLFPFGRRLISDTIVFVSHKCRYCTPSAIKTYRLQ